MTGKQRENGGSNYSPRVLCQMASLEPLVPANAVRLEIMDLALENSEK